MRRQRQFSGATEIRAIGGLPRFEAPAWTINPATPQPGRVVISSRSLNELAALLNCGIGSSPRHDRYRRGRILRRPVDQLLPIHHVNQYVPLGVASAADLHFLAEQRTPPPEHS